MVAEVDDIFNRITDQLKKTNHQQLLEELTLCADGAGTGGEGLAITGKYLLDLKTTHPEVFLENEKAINQYLFYCKRNGVLIR